MRTNDENYNFFIIFRRSHSHKHNRIEFNVKQNTKITQKRHKVLQLADKYQ